MKQVATSVNNVFLFWILLVILLVYGRPILVPICFGILLSMLMAPLTQVLDNLSIKRIFSTLICIFILLLAVCGFIYVIGWQILSLQKELPAIESKLNNLIHDLHDWIAVRFGYSIEQQQEFLQKQLQDLGKASASYFTKIIEGTANVILQLAVTFVVTFLLLYQKEKYHQFFLQLLRRKEQKDPVALLDSMTQVSRQYLVGRLISISILFALYLLSLWIIGIENALMLALVAAIVNIIPYLGPFLAGLFPALFSLVTEDTFNPALWVVLTFCIIQAIDNYFVTPYFMGNEVHLSALSTILIIICGGYIWGVSGMILFVPLLSLVKIVLDHVEELKPYGYLLGDINQAS